MNEQEIEDIKYKLSKLLTASELSAKTKISASRLLDLAESGYLPHWKVSGGEPLFHLPEAREWLLKNVVTRSDGNPIPTFICVVSDAPVVSPENLPRAIRSIPNLVDITATLEIRSGIYFLCMGKEVVYVGQSKSVSKRIISHIGFKDFDRVICLPWPAHDLSRVEGALIRTLTPKLNGGFARERYEYISAPVERTPDEDVLREIGFCQTSAIFENFERPEILVHSQVIENNAETWCARRDSNSRPTDS